MMKRLLGVLFVLSIALPAPAQDGYKDEIRKLLDDAMTLYKRGKFSEAYTKFEQALQKIDKDPDRRGMANLVYAFLERVGSDKVTGMMSAPDARIQDLGHRLFKIAQPGRAIREGKKHVLGYVEDLKSDSFEIYRNGHWHLKNYGSWACRFLVPILRDKTQDRRRTRVMLLLTDMGVDATLPVIECLNSKEIFLRQTAAIVLGNIRDERAIPALRRLTEDTNEKPEVRKYAHEALQRITRKPDAEWKKAVEYYYNLAEKYYYGNSGVIFEWQRYYLIWKWDTEKDRLLERRCARFVFNEQLAEEALFDLLELDPNYATAKGESAWALLVMTMFQQALEAEAAAFASVEALKRGEIDRKGLIQIVQGIEGTAEPNLKGLTTLLPEIPEFTDKMSEEELKTYLTAVRKTQEVLLRYFESRAKVLRSNILAVVPGRRYLYEALARSMKDQNHLVAKACIEAIKELGEAKDLPLDRRETPGANGKTNGTAAPTGEGIGYPLVEALTSPDKRVRYAAAEAMVKLNPQERRLGMELVIPNLIDALGEQGVRVALVIYDVQSEADRNFINRLKKTLVSLNLFPVIATSGAEGVVKAKAFPTEDVIILQKKIAGQVYFEEKVTRRREKESIIRTLSLDVRTRNIPRILLCEDEAERKAAETEFSDNTAYRIKKDTHKLDLKEMLRKIFDQPEAKKDSKDRADQISRRAAESLASIDPTNTRYPYRDAVDALIRTVSPDPLREDFIRIPAALALGVYGDQRAIDVLARVLDDRDETRSAMQKPLRLQCARSLSSIFRQTGAAPRKEVLAVLVKYCVADGDYEVERACGEALGNAKLTNEQRRDIQKKRRVRRDWYTKDDP